MQLDVESVLHSLGIEVIREYGDEVLGKCPLHLQRTGKEDRHPSWSINVKTYVHHCFSCGYSGTLSSLYRDLTGEVPEDLEWELSKKSLLASIEVKKEQTFEGPKVNEWVLNNYTDVPSRLLARRNVSRESIDRFEVKWDSESKAWVIPIRGKTGELMGFQFRQKGTVINHPPGMEKSKTLFGFHLFANESRITVVESPLDAVRLNDVGVPAVSSFGASVSLDQVELLARNFRYVVAAMDNDEPGRRANGFLRKSLVHRGCVVFDFDYVGLEAKDPGDVEDNAVLRDAWDRSVSLNMIGRP